MNGDDPKKHSPAAEPSAPPAPANGGGNGEGNGSGKGADTAFQAMLRKRKQAELPEPPDTVPPAPPRS